MSVISKVESFFKSVGSHIKAGFVRVFGQETGETLAKAAESWAKTELGKMPITVVHGLESAALVPADKKAEALRQIAELLAAEGKELPAHVLNFAIEFALLALRSGSANAASA